MDQPTRTGSEVSLATRLPLESKRRSPLILLGLLALAAVLALSFTAFRRSVVYYYTATEALAQPQNTSFRLSGDVVKDSIKFQPEQGLVTFKVTDGGSTIDVVYEGPAPDTLKNGAQAVAEGKLGTDGVFRSTKLFARCPSKFEKAKGTS